MISANRPPLRSLSPITELTTPNSLRTLTLPQDDADYRSEHPDQHDDDDDASVYSKHSTDTVTQDAPPLNHTVPPRLTTGATTTADSNNHARQRTTSLPIRGRGNSPTLPVRSPYRPRPLPLHSRSFSTSDRYVPFSFRSAPLPGGLLPPPRNPPPKVKPSRPLTPPPPLKLVHRRTVSDEARDRIPSSHEENEDEEGHSAVTESSDSNHITVARVGIEAGSGLHQSWPMFGADSDERKTSPKKQSMSETDLTRSATRVSLERLSYPVLLNVPLEEFPAATSLKDSSRFSPRLLKKKSRSPPGTRLWGDSNRPNSYHGKPKPGGVLVANVTGANRLSPLGSPIQSNQEMVEQSGTTPVGRNAARQSSRSPDSLKSTDSRTTPPSRNNTTHRRRVSGLLSSIFGSDAQRDGNMTRKLSKRSRNANGSLISHTPPSSSPNTAGQADSDESPAPLQLQRAIRTSGTFGIPDDGSDIYGAHGYHRSPSLENPPGSASSRVAFGRAESTDGSVITHSEGVRRVLYVENLMEEEEGPGEGAPLIDEESTFYDAAQTELKESGPVGQVGNGHYTAFDESSHPDHPTDQLPSRRNSTRISQPSTALAGDTTSRRNSAISEMNSFHDRPYSSAVYIHGNDIPEHQDIHTDMGNSRYVSPHSTPRSRPRPQSPSQHASPRLKTPEPTFIPPLPPGQNPTSELPLLIASHLLSTHAAALMRHSTTIQEINRSMRRMAQESLDWGSVLMEMAQKTPSSESDMPDGLPITSSAPSRRTSAVYDGVPLPRASDTSLGENAMTSRPHTPFTSRTHSREYDPVQAAYDNLTAMPTRPSLTRRLARAQERERKGESLPADLLKEAERLGQQGWASLHVAEEAWTSAMEQLGQIVEVSQEVEHEVPVPVSGGSQSRAGIASTRTSTTTYDYDRHSTLSPLSAVAHAFPVASQPQPGDSVPPSSSSYQLDPTTSFLPNMIHSPTSPQYPSSREVEDKDATIKIRPRPKAVHAFSNPLIQPVDQHLSTRPVSQIPERGYTDDQLRVQLHSNSGEESAPSSSLDMSRARNSLINSTSTSATHNAAKSTRRLKKSTRHNHTATGSTGDDEQRGNTIRSNVTRNSKDEQMDYGCVSKGSGRSRSERMRKHWWSRRTNEVDQ
ncbi:hypothetical protein CI109_106857 [Kwoniella shandongensis]|uniref:Uncharacterized protein n=1 Tax=Kwoniella shandongensis TaxID=1734106 RepID=A0AAJ8LPL3_9TREE